MCDVLFIKSADQKNVYGGLDAYELTAYEPPLWTSLLAGYARSKGYDVEVIDAEVEQLSPRDLSIRILEANSLLTVLTVSGTNPSASTQNMSAAGKIAEEAKKLNQECKIAIHGIHPTALPERTLREEKVDFVVMNEGFETICHLLEALKNRSKDIDLCNIQGLGWLKEGQVIITEPPKLVKDLDEIPMAAWDLLPMHKYRAHNWHCFDHIERRQPYAVLWTSLGCPFHCHFCCINSIFGASGIRFRSPENVMAEIDFLVEKYHVKNIKIMDELFALNESRVCRICEMIIDRKYDLNIWAYARVDTVTQRMLHMMKKAGINWIAYGFESGSRKSLEDVEKGYRLDKVAEIVDCTYREGLYIGANYMFGLPEDDYTAMQQTLNMAMEINSEWANFNMVMAYPGSGLFEDAQKNHITLPETWQGYSQYSNDSLPMNTRYLSPEEVVDFRDYAFQSYFKNPRYLDKIRKQFGDETVRHICNMTKYTLPRNNSILNRSR